MFDLGLGQRNRLGELLDVEGKLFDSVLERLLLFRGVVKLALELSYLGFERLDLSATFVYLALDLLGGVGMSRHTDRKRSCKHNKKGRD